MDIVLYDDACFMLCAQLPVVWHAPVFGLPHMALLVPRYFLARPRFLVPAHSSDALVAYKISIT